MTGALTWRLALALIVLMEAAALAVFWLDTRPFDAASRLGYDGYQYAAMVAWLRGDHSVTPQSPFTYRILVPLVVAASGLDVNVGYFVVDAAALMASGLVLAALLRSEGAPPAVAVWIVALWAALPNVLRHIIVYPVLVDAAGFFMFVLALLLARRSVTAFALALAAGVLVREHLVLLAPLAAVRHDRSPYGKPLLAVLPALVALVAVHALPIFPSAGASSFDVAVVNFVITLLDVDGALVRLFVAPLFALGAFVAIALAAPARVATMLRERGNWYVALVIALTGTVGGLDHDRYFFWWSALLAIASARVAWSLPGMAVIAAAHIVTTRVLMPLDGSESAYLAFAPKTMPLGDVGSFTLRALLVTTIAALVLRATSRATPTAAPRAA